MATGNKTKTAKKNAPAPAARRTPKQAPSKTRVESAPPRAAPGLLEIANELKTVKQLIETLSPPPAASGGEALEPGVGALRRVLSETIEKHNESVIAETAAALDALRSGRSDARAAAAELLEKLLARLGAVRFEAEKYDFVDPSIHAVAREDSAPDAPDGVITAALMPGYKTARGVVVSKARVAVNRR